MPKILVHVVHYAQMDHPESIVGIYKCPVKAGLALSEERLAVSRIPSLAKVIWTKLELDIDLDD